MNKSKVNLSFQFEVIKQSMLFRKILKKFLDEENLLSPHPEARKARIKILGKIDPNKKGFKPSINEVRFDYSYTREVPTEKTSAYAKFSTKYCGQQFIPWKNWFYVVRESGKGNFHNIINLSNEWVLLLLEKELLDQKPIHIKPYLKKLSSTESKKLQIMIRKIEELGDTIFNDKQFVTDILKFPENILIPIFIQMLNIQETGKHDNCTFFAFLLKLAKKNKNLVLLEVKNAMTLKTAPYYYLEDLEKKLS